MGNISKSRCSTDALMPTYADFAGGCSMAQALGDGARAARLRRGPGS